MPLRHFMDEYIPLTILPLDKIVNDIRPNYYATAHNVKGYIIWRTGEDRVLNPYLASSSCAICAIYMFIYPADATDNEN
jgi:hypothetical protein